MLTLCKGITNIVPVTVSNLDVQGGPIMQAVQLSLSSRNIVETGNAVDINNVTPKNSSVGYVPIFLDLNTSASLITIQANINYNYYLSTYSDSEVKNLTFEVQSCPTPLLVNVSPSTLSSGQVNIVKFNFTNTGNTTLNDITAHAAVGGISNRSAVEFLGGFPIEIASLPPQNTISINEKIYENTSQIFPINVTVVFFNGTQVEQSLESFIILSTGTINLAPSSITVSPANVTPGGIFSVSFIVTDTGTIGASDAMATALLPNGFKPYGSNSVYIGSISTATETPISFTIIPNTSIKDGKYTISVNITYENNLRQNLSTTVNVSVDVGGTSFSANSIGSGTYTRTGGFSSTRRSSENYDLYIAVGVVAVIILVAALFLWRRRRKAKPKK